MSFFKNPGQPSCPHCDQPVTYIRVCHNDPDTRLRTSCGCRIMECHAWELIVESGLSFYDAAEVPSPAAPSICETCARPERPPEHFWNGLCAYHGVDHCPWSRNV